MRRAKKQFGLLLAIVVLTVTFSSCSDDQNNPISYSENSTTTTLTTDVYSGPGATFIGMIMTPYSNDGNYFYYGPPQDLGNRQEFVEGVFTDPQDFMVVTAENGQPNYYGGNQRVGVWDLVNGGMDGNLIDDNEVLVMTLGSDIPAGVKMVSASVNFSGGGTASIDLYDGVTLVGNVVATGTGLVNINAGGALFNQIKFASTSGSYGIISGSQFNLASVNFVGVHTFNGTGNKYAYYSVNGIGNPNRQQMDVGNINGNGSGAFNAASPNGNQWLVCSSSPGLPSYFGGNFSWGVGGNSRIDVGESMRLVKGINAPKDFIAARIQYRNATAGAVARVIIKKSGSTLNTFLINLSTAGTFEISSNQEFDEIVFESQTGTWNPIGQTNSLTRLYNTPL